jgi:tetratricopeptide (TPR) repeat protein
VYGQDAEPAWRTTYKQGLDAFKRGDLSEAEHLYTDATSKAEGASPPQIEPGVVTCLIAIAYIYDKRGDYKESERLYELAMRDMEGLVGRGSPRYLAYLADLGDLYNKHGRPDQAEVTFNQLTQGFEHADPPNNIKLAESLERYAKFLRRCDRALEAAIPERRAKTLRNSSPADNSQP